MSLGEHAGVWRTATQILLWRHGWVWPLALVLWLLAMTGQLFLVAPGRDALAATKTELVRESAASQRRPVPPPMASEQQQLETQRTWLRASPSTGELVEKMAVLAAEEQIVLTQSDYQQQFHGATQITQVQITQPVRANYPQLRRYIEAVLRNIPNASLDQISARRDTVGQSQLEIRLRWSLWIQTPAAAGSRKPLSAASTL